MTSEYAATLFQGPSKETFDTWIRRYDEFLLTERMFLRKKRKKEEPNSCQRIFWPFPINAGIARKHYFRGCQHLQSRPDGSSRQGGLGYLERCPAADVNEKCKLVRLPLPIAAFQPEGPMSVSGKNF
ncbi:hypothetical protein ANTQUA_LOCUS10377 [Anthophora quadrimaculata]